MPTWLKKTLVILITVLTLGTVTPPAHLFADSAGVSNSKSDVIQRKTNEVEEQSQSEVDEAESIPEQELFSLPWNEVAATAESSEELGAQFVDYTVYQANEQTLEKFGPKISQKLGDEYQLVILPKIEEVISLLSQKLGEQELRNIVITDRPSSGTGERIFHISNRETGKDYVRFHVRRENKPLQGYWFSFHYHTSEDNYEKHHEIGKLFWDKNTPPNWMTH
jgi:hypothetical protein